MKSAEFIQLHLFKKGVPADLTTPTVFTWSKNNDPSKKPLVFQSPIKILFMHGSLIGLLWSAIMWIFVWRHAPELWVNYLISSVLVGLFMGFINMYRVIKARKRLGGQNWEDWFRNHYE